MDRTSLRIYVHDCPPREGPFLAGYFRHDPRNFEVDWSHPCPAGLETDRPYTLSEASFTALKDITTELRQKAPGASFTAWTDCSDEGPGELIAYMPGLGEYTAGCDGGGEPLFSSEQVTSLINEAEAAYSDDGLIRVDSIRDAFHRAMGGPWLDYRDQHAEQSARQLVADYQKERS